MLILIHPQHESKVDQWSPWSTFKLNEMQIKGIDPKKVWCGFFGEKRTASAAIESNLQEIRLEMWDRLIGQSHVNYDIKYNYMHYKQPFIDA